MNRMVDKLQAASLAGVAPPRAQSVITALKGGARPDRAQQAYRPAQGLAAA